MSRRVSQLRRVEANYGVSGANYVVSRKITACRGNLRRIEANYGVSGKITECRGKLRSVGPNYGVSGQITECLANCGLSG